MRSYVAAWAVAALALSGCAAVDPGAGGRPQPSVATKTVTESVTVSAGPSGGVTGTPAPPPRTTPTASATSRPPTATPSPRPGTVPPDWLGTRVLPTDAAGFGEIRPTPPMLRTRRFTLPDQLPPLPGDGFAGEISPVPDEVLARSTWEPGCPVGRDELRWVRVAFWGFDDARHTGELLVNAAVAEDLVQVFGRLYDARFPLEEMRITRPEELDAPPTGDGNNTGAFVCRATRGSTTYSQHAYGLAVDVNPFQNPYLKGDLVLPELASAYLDRRRKAPGMIHVGGVVTSAFAEIGWGWGGSWSSLADYQHFSQNHR